MNLFRFGLLPAVLLAAGMPLLAQKADFTAAEKFDAPKLLANTGTLKVIPFFLKKSDAFWFRYQDSAGERHYIVDPAKPVKQLLYDKAAILAQLKQFRKEPIDTAALRYSFSFGSDEKTVELSYKNSKYSYYFYEKRLAVIPGGGRAATRLAWPPGTVSPNRQWQLYARAHNLYLGRVEDTSATPLSADAERYYSFNINEDDTSESRHSPTNAAWLPDSKRFYVIRKDRRKVGTMTVMYSMTFGRPRAETYKYELPGDKDVTQYELFIGDTASRRMLKVNTAKWPDQELEVVCADGRSDELFFTRRKRTRDEIELCAVNTLTGRVRVVIHETSKPVINEDLFAVAVLNGGRDILWWSDRSGWGQYYLYGADGQLKHAVTQGAWTAGRVLAIDTPGRQLYFYGYGRESGRNPYFAHAYRADLDGGQPLLLTPEDASHDVFISKQGYYLVDNFSRINLAPESVLRNKRGVLLCRLAKPDLGRLYRMGWKAPEPFTVKAKDGVTDLYGIMWKPFDFDSTKKYPVISQVYPGPQTETVWAEFTVLDKYNNTSLAQVGFIVVCMGHRGGSPLRNKAYHTYGYGNLRDYALEDDKYGLEQLAARYGFMDLNRLGIYGHSGGAAMAVAAICTYPGFYKVAVASSGNHDNTIYNHNWGETYQGLQEETDSAKITRAGTPFRFHTDVNASLANRLQGHLLLVTGESDKNVHPGNTYRMADALIKAGKDFDLLVLPGQSHHYEGVYDMYFHHKKWQYFARWLIE